MSRASPRARRALGLHFVPEERLGRGAVPTLSLAQNTLLTRTENVGRRRLAPHRARSSAWPHDFIERFNVKAGGPGAAARSLSGGNLQKFIVGREIDARPKLLIVSQPTWGVDVGAAAQIRGEMLALRDAGCAVLVVSEELDELFRDQRPPGRDRQGPSAPERVGRAGDDRADRRVDEWALAESVRRARSPPMLRLEARPQPSKACRMASPLLALLVTVLIGMVLFALLGKDPVRALQMFFWEPIKSAYAWTEIAVKATPLILIALGLAVCYRSNVWNIGAEGQFVIGAVVRRRRGDAGQRRHAACDRAGDPARRHRRRHGVGRHRRAAA